MFPQKINCTNASNRINVLIFEGYIIVSLDRIFREKVYWIQTLPFFTILFNRVNVVVFVSPIYAMTQLIIKLSIISLSSSAREKT